MKYSARIATRQITPAKPTQFIETHSASENTLEIAMLGTFPPRKCGLATFTNDIIENFRRFRPWTNFKVFALDNPSDALTYDRDVHSIEAQAAQDYILAARLINRSTADAVWIQHEFGIFGGRDGVYVLDFLEELTKPAIVTFHTVLEKPSASQLRIMKEIVAKASQLMVMSSHGRALLEEIYGASASKISVIAHGAPDRPFGREEIFKSRLGLAQKRVLTTFGLLGPGKGLEHMIDALPAIVRHHPDIVYRIIGQTHPALIASEGEQYRNHLIARASANGVAGYIQWVDRFLETSSLLDQLEAADIYITPYGNLQQATSGTLSYAVALGKAVVSTPYVHARELLAGGVGILIDPEDDNALPAAILSMLDDPELLEKTKRKAYAAGRDTIWSEFVCRSAAMIGKAIRGKASRATSGRAAYVPAQALTA